MEKQQFMDWANKVLQKDEVVFIGTSDMDEAGFTYEQMLEKTGEKCKIVIRDFSVDMPRLSEPNFNDDFDINKCDTEFTDAESAWKHLSSLDRYRVMDSCGNIEWDNYVGDSQ